MFEKNSNGWQNGTMLHELVMTTPIHLYDAGCHSVTHQYRACCMQTLKTEAYITCIYEIFIDILPDLIVNLLICIWNPAYCLRQMSRSRTKPTKWPVRPAKTQISLGICPVWSVFAVRMKKQWDLSYPLSEHRRLWSDCADAQADLSFSWAHMSFCWFCRAVAQIF